MDYSKDKWKPERCPFCGNSDIFPETNHERDHAQAKCSECHACGPFVDQIGGWWAPMKAWDSRCSEAEGWRRELVKGRSLMDEFESDMIESLLVRSYTRLDDSTFKDPEVNSWWIAWSIAKGFPLKLSEEVLYKNYR